MMNYETPTMEIIYFDEENLQTDGSTDDGIDFFSMSG